MTHNLTRRGFLQAGGGATLAAALAGCGFGVGGSQQGSGSATTLWDIQTDKQQELLKQIINGFNSSHDGMTVRPQFFQNDPYKNKLRVSMGSDEPPDLFYGWGGGVLKSYIDAGKVHNLDGKVDPNRFFSSVLAPVTFNGSLYGAPNAGTAPVVFLYNKPVFDEHNISPPTTYSELLDAIRTLRSAGVTPISLAGKNKWPGMCWEEYLVDRIGGPDVFQRVMDGVEGAWSDPAFIQASTMIQELVKMNAFPENFTSLDYDTGDATQLLYSGEAAMHLMGTWEFGTVLNDAPEFIENGNLGWFAFPNIEDGAGDPTNVVGNPCTYYSVTEASTTKDTAVAFLNDALMNEQHVNGWIELGSVPPVQGIESNLQQSDHADWVMFVYNLGKNASNFQMQWDQALSPETAQELLTNLDLLFLQDITPQQFSDRMNETLSSGGSQ